MINWPHWYPGLELKTEHLVGLEDYMLSRIVMGDDTGHGIEECNWQRSLSISQAGEGVVIRVTGPLRGLTPGGFPVVIGEEDRLETLVTTRGLDTFLLDIAVEIRPADPDTRVRVCAERVESSRAPVRPCDNASRLYLGRYRFGRQDALELIQRPLVRHFAGLQPIDPSWKRWVEPLSSRLHTVLYDLEHGQDSADPRTITMLSVASRLAFDWSSCHLPRLALQLRFFAWLHSRRDGLEDHRSNVMRYSFPPNDAIGDELPQLLAQLLPKTVPVRALPDLLDQLLAPIYLRTPVAEFRQWEKHVLNFRSPQILEQLTMSLQQRLAHGSLDDWSRAVGLLTMVALRHSINFQWPDNIVRSYLEPSGTSLEVGTGLVLERLYKGKAQVAPAGPLGFLSLARVAGNIPFPQGSLPIVVQTYFESQKIAPRAVPLRVEPALAQNDRVLAHLVMRQMQDTQKAENPHTGPRLPRAPIRALAPESHNHDIHVGVVGTPGSGKSTLLRSYVSYARNPSGVSSGFSPVFNDNSPSALPQNRLFSCEGELTLGQDVFALRLFETADELFPRPPTGHSGVSPVAGVVQGFDLIILAIDAATIDVKPEQRPRDLMATLAQKVQYARQANPRVMVSIAYTKSDEFGVVDPTSLRVMEDDTQVAALARLSSTQTGSLNKNWENFLDGVAPTRDGDKWNETRRIVLNQTRELWISLARDIGGPSLAINGYFVSADPLDNYLVPWARRGLVQLFNDFYDYFQEITLHTSQER